MQVMKFRLKVIGVTTLSCEAELQTVLGPDRSKLVDAIHTRDGTAAKTIIERQRCCVKTEL